jgi:hypothetical protein
MCFLFIFKIKIIFSNGKNCTVCEFDSVDRARKYYDLGLDGHELKQALYTFNETEFNIESPQAMFFAINADSDKKLLEDYLKTDEYIQSVLIHPTQNLINENFNLFFINFSPDILPNVTEIQENIRRKVPNEDLKISLLRLRHALEESIINKDSSSSRYVDNEELKYSLRSIGKVSEYKKYWFSCIFNHFLI